MPGRPKSRQPRKSYEFKRTHKHAALSCLVASSLSGSCAPKQSAAAQAAAGGVPVWTARIRTVFDHDKNSFTEGLFTADGLIYESSGIEGQSLIRAYDQSSGKNTRTSPSLGAGLFGEGVAPVTIAGMNPRIYQLTWQAQKGIAFDATNRTLLITGKSWPKMYQIDLPK